MITILLPATPPIRIEEGVKVVPEPTFIGSDVTLVKDRNNKTIALIFGGRCVVDLRQAEA